MSGSCIVAVVLIMFVFTIFFSTIMVFVSWTASITKPYQESYVDYFYIPALNKSTDPTKPNTTISFHLRLENLNKNTVLYYKTLNLTFLYQPPLKYTRNIVGTINNNTYQVIGNTTFFGFHQYYGKKAVRRGSIDPSGIDWEPVYGASLNGSNVVFRVNLETSVKTQDFIFKHGWRKRKVRAIVEINNNGLKSKKKGIRLKSGADQQGCYSAHLSSSWAMLSFYVLINFVL